VQLARLSVAPAALERRIAEERRRVAALSDRLRPALDKRLRDGRKEVRAIHLRPPDVARARERFVDRMARLQTVAERQQTRRVTGLDALDKLRLTLGYEATLERGYAVVRGDGDVITGVGGAKAAEVLEIQFADGRVKVGASSRKPARKSKPKDPPDEQGSLL